jgi:hypothetical protein|tara:strand:- start:482 stop:1195 length:714 start_codon:yes stop_codon:yes gene_type:complete
MRDDVVLVIDTNSNYSDVWDPCFGRLDRFAPGIKKYIFTDSDDGVPDDITPVFYDNEASYRNQLLSCLKQIEQKYIIYTSEDYILYNQVQLEEIENVSNVLDETNYSFCKFIKGPELTSHFKDNLYIIDQGDPNFFAQQASIWKTRDFQSIFEAAPSENTRMQHEPGGSDICRQLGLSGLQYFSNTNKRGIHHYDSEIFPCIATAVVKGLWNMSEYPNEMADVVREFKINISSRGWR